MWYRGEQLSGIAVTGKGKLWQSRQKQTLLLLKSPVPLLLLLLLLLLMLLLLLFESRGGGRSSVAAASQRIKAFCKSSCRMDFGVIWLKNFKNIYWLVAKICSHMYRKKLKMRIWLSYILNQEDWNVFVVLFRKKCLLKWKIQFIFIVYLILIEREGTTKCGRQARIHFRN